MLELLLNKTQREESTQESLDALVKDSARKMLTEALQAEVREYIEKHQNELGFDGMRNAKSNAKCACANLCEGFTLHLL